MACGDFNGDQVIDLAVASHVGDSLSIYLGAPNGSFSDRVEYASGDMPYWISLSWLIDAAMEANASEISIPSAS